MSPSPPLMYDFILQALCEEAVALTYTEQDTNWVSDVVATVVRTYNEKIKGSK